MLQGLWLMDMTETLPCTWWDLPERNQIQVVLATFILEFPFFECSALNAT